MSHLVPNRTCQSTRCTIFSRACVCSPAPAYVCRPLTLCRPGSRHYRLPKRSKPGCLDHEYAAGVPMAGLTAWQALFDHAHLSSKDTILIHGVAGAWVALHTTCSMDWSTCHWNSFSIQFQFFKRFRGKRCE